MSEWRRKSPTFMCSLDSAIQPYRMHSLLQKLLAALNPELYFGVLKEHVLFWGAGLSESVSELRQQQLNRTVFPFHLEAKTAAPERFLHFSDFAYWLFTLRWLILNLFCLINYLSALPSVPRLDWELWIIYCYSCWSDQRITTTVLSWVGELPVLGLRRWLDNKWWRDDRFRMYPWSSEGSSRQKSPVRWVAVLRPALTADRRHVLITQQQQQQQSVL